MMDFIEDWWQVSTFDPHLRDFTVRCICTKGRLIDVIQELDKSDTVGSLVIEIKHPTQPVVDAYVAAGNSVQHEWS